MNQVTTVPHEGINCKNQRQTLDTEVRIVYVSRIRWYKIGTVSTEEIYPLVISFLCEQLGLVFI